MTDKNDAYKKIAKGVACLNQVEWGMTKSIIDRLFEKKISHIQLNDSDLQKNLADYFEDKNKSEMDDLFKSFPSKP